MSFARYASTTSPLAYKPPPRPKPKPAEADHGVYFGRTYRIRRHPDWTIVPERFASGDNHRSIFGYARNVRTGERTSLYWSISELELID